MHGSELSLLLYLHFAKSPMFHSEIQYISPRSYPSLSVLLANPPTACGETLLGRAGTFDSTNHMEFGVYDTPRSGQFTTPAGPAARDGLGHSVSESTTESKLIANGHGVLIPLNDRNCVHGLAMEVWFKDSSDLAKLGSSLQLESTL